MHSDINPVAKFLYKQKPKKDIKINLDASKQNQLYNQYHCYVDTLK